MTNVIYLIDFVEQSKIQIVLPVIKHFSLNIYIDIKDDILLKLLIQYWCAFIEVIQIFKQIDQANKDTQANFIHHRNMILLKINQSNKQCQTKWIQTDCQVFKFIAQIDARG